MHPVRAGHRNAMLIHNAVLNDLDLILKRLQRQQFARLFKIQKEDENVSKKRNAEHKHSRHAGSAK